MRIGFYCFLSVFFACVVQVVRMELFTALAHLERVLFAEKQVVDFLKETVRYQEEKLTALRSITGKYERLIDKYLRNPTKQLENPVNAFLLVKRLTLDWNKISQLLESNSTNGVSLRSRINRKNLPGIDDFYGAAKAILRLQDTYQLTTEEIARGNIRGAASEELSAEDCYEIGKLAYNTEDFYHTILWMEEALAKWENETTKTISKEVILDYLAFSTYKKGNIRHALSLVNELLSINPNHQRAQSNKVYFEKLITEKMKNSPEDSDKEIPFTNLRRLDLIRNNTDHFSYEVLCRGKNSKKIKDVHKLKCRYVHDRTPFLKLAPVKEEDVLLDPWIVIYYDVLYDSETEVLKTLATPNLKRSFVVSGVTGKTQPTEHRINKSAWVDQGEHPKIATIYSRIKSVTGMNLASAESLQVANYGIGGHYELHYDFFVSAKNMDGNRIATFLIYMNDVEAGGATVFPGLGVKVFPKKGMALFWHNLLRSGKENYATRHAACPVLLGAKWVTTLWIHEWGQEFLRPCSLNRLE